MSDLVSVSGAVDLHVHSSPCLFPRLADDRQMVEWAQAAGMRAIVLKCHHESTASRAYLLDSEYPDIRVFGGLVLNTYVGGLNPRAVEAALRGGAKEIWMPTVDAAYHADMHGGRTGAYDVQSSGGQGHSAPGISVLRDGTLKGEVEEILDLIAEYGAILGTAHLSKPEIHILIANARERGVSRILITHPFFKVPGLDLPFIKELVEMGAIAEFGYCTVSPMWAYASIGDVKKAIQELGAEHCVIMSDSGQRHNPTPPESLRVFAQCLFEQGLTMAEIRTLIEVNPVQLLGPC